MGFYVMRIYRDSDRRQIIATGLTEEEAQNICRDPESSSKTATSKTAKARTKCNGPWFNCYDEKKSKR